MSSRIDVSIEHKNAPEPPARSHPNTCPGCDSHYRDDELEAHLWVCPQCGHHFPMRARARIAHLADEGSFVETSADLRSEDPLQFFDVRPYTERLAEAEVSTGLGEAIVTGQAAIEGRLCELAVMDFAFMGGSMGSVVGEKLSRACDSAAERAAEPLERRKARRVGRETRQARTHDGAAAANLAEERLDLRDLEAVRLRHERRHLAGIEDVAVERDVDAVDVRERPLDCAVARRDPGLGDELDLRRVEVARSDERDVVRAHRPGVEDHP